MFRMQGDLTIGPSVPGLLGMAATSLIPKRARMPTRSPAPSFRFSKLLLPACLALSLSACYSRSHNIVATPSQLCDDSAPVPQQLKVVSYNIKSASYNGDRLQDLAEVLRGLDADFIALQEVQAHQEDQATTLARMLGYPYHVFVAAIRKAPGDYGIALLSRIPLERVDNVRLEYPIASEPRVAIDAVACLGKRRLHVVNVHADFIPFANTGMAAELAKYLQPIVSSGASLVLMGDLNAQPKDDAVKQLTRVGLHDLFAEMLQKPALTFPSDHPNARIDYVMVDSPLLNRARPPEVPDTEASDHRPVLTRFDLSGW